MDEGADDAFHIDELIPLGERTLRRFPRLLHHAFRLVWRAARRPFIITAVLQAGAGLAVVAQLLVGKLVLDELVGSDHPSFGAVMPKIAAFAAVTACAQIMNFALAEQNRILTALVERSAILQVIDVAAAVDLVAYDRPAFHNRLQRAQTNAALRPGQMVNGLTGVIGAGLAIAGLGSTLLFLQPLFLVLVLIAFVPVWLTTRRASRLVYHYVANQTERDRRRSYLYLVLTSRELAAEVRAFSLGDYFRQRHDAIFDEKLQELREVVRQRLLIGLVGGTLTALISGATIAVLVWSVTAGHMDLSAAGATAGALVLLAQRMYSFVGSAGSLYENSLFLEDFTTFVDSLPGLVAGRPSGPAPAEFSSIVADHVTFTYPSRTIPALQDVSVQIRKGEIVALVGENGSGKTTLAKLLAGLYSPDAGSVRWDDVDVSTCDPDQLRSGIALIFQDFAQYFMSARDNIGVGRTDRIDDFDAIVEAARHASADAFIRQLPLGYDHLLGPEYAGGADLSIGQWQRMALARAFFRNAPFIVLDEPTAALDPRAESELFDNIRVLFEGRAVVLISHRFSSVRSADRIYVLRHGRIIEQGSHEELMADAGVYSELFTLQAAAYLGREVRRAD